jgi:hypothetical protein
MGLAGRLPRLTRGLPLRKPGSCINTLLFFEETVLYKGVAGCDKCVAGLHP